MSQSQPAPAAQVRPLHCNTGGTRMPSRRCPGTCKLCTKQRTRLSSPR